MGAHNPEFTIWQLIKFTAVICVSVLKTLILELLYQQTNVKTIRPHTLLPHLKDTINYMVYSMLTYELNKYSYVARWKKSFPERNKCQSYMIPWLCTNDS